MTESIIKQALVYIGKKMTELFFTLITLDGLTVSLFGMTVDMYIHIVHRMNHTIDKGACC